MAVHYVELLTEKDGPSAKYADDVWLPAVPMPDPTFKGRMKDVWGVLIGRYQAFDMEGRIQ